MSDATQLPEVGNSAHFEHINLRVSDHVTATNFFVAGLGLTRDPYRMVGTENMWVNIGTQQFHLPVAEPTPFPGEIGISLPDLEQTRQRLAIVARKLEGTHFAFAPDGDTLRITSPWGHQFIAHDAGAMPGRLPMAIPYVRFHVPPGMAVGIGRYYADLLGCPVEGAHDGVRVTVGPHQHFHFQERPGAVSIAHTNHVCLYISRYWETYAAIQERQLVYERDMKGWQFRILHLLDPAVESGPMFQPATGGGPTFQPATGGGNTFQIEHELRSFYHPDFLKPLVNRHPVPYLVD